jgi:hypothetical protein
MNMDTNIIAFGMTLNNFIQIELSIGTLNFSRVSTFTVKGDLVFFMTESNENETVSTIVNWNGFRIGLT